MQCILNLTIDYRLYFLTSTCKYYKLYVTDALSYISTLIAVFISYKIAYRLTRVISQRQAFVIELFPTK